MVICFTYRREQPVKSEKKKNSSYKIETNTFSL